MTQQLHRLIDSGAEQPVINERIAGLIEADQKALGVFIETVSKITSDHEARVRYLERTMSWGLGIGAAVVSITGLVITLFKVVK